MRSRPFRPEDLPVLQKIFHQRGLPYGNIDITRLVVAEVLVDENDVPVIAVLAKPTVELFVLVDQTWATPQKRWQGFKLLHEVVRKLLADAGIEQAHAWLAPQLAKAFKRRLQSLKWEVAECISMFRRTRIPELGE